MPVNKEQCCKAARIKWFLHQNIIKRQKNIATEVRTSVKLTPNFKPPPYPLPTLLKNILCHPTLKVSII